MSGGLAAISSRAWPSVEAPRRREPLALDELREHLEDLQVVVDDQRTRRSHEHFLGAPSIPRMPHQILESGMTRDRNPRTTFALRGGAVLALKKAIGERVTLMNARPPHDRLLVGRLEDSQTTKSRTIIPDALRKSPGAASSLPPGAAMR